MVLPRLNNLYIKSRGLDRFAAHKLVFVHPHVPPSKQSETKQRYDTDNFAMAMFESFSPSSPPSDADGDFSCRYRPMKSYHTHITIA
jgi:hypothetical protein